MNARKPVKLSVRTLTSEKNAQPCLEFEEADPEAELQRTRTLVLMAFVEAEEPLNPKDISEMTGLTSYSQIHYHIHQLVTLGVLIPWDEVDNTFQIQELFFNEDLIKRADALIKMIWQECHFCIFTAGGDELCEQCDRSKKPRILANNMLEFMYWRLLATCKDPEALIPGITAPQTVPPEALESVQEDLK